LLAFIRGLFTDVGAGLGLVMGLPPLPPGLIAGLGAGFGLVMGLPGIGLITDFVLFII
jgi:hypothetical protein